MLGYALDSNRISTYIFGPFKKHGPRANINLLVWKVKKKPFTFFLKGNF